MFIPEDVLFEFWLWQGFQLVEGFVVLIVIAMVAPHASALTVRYNDNICSKNPLYANGLLKHMVSTWYSKVWPKNNLR